MANGDIRIKQPHPNVRKMLEQLRQQGIYGTTVDEVAERLMLGKLVDLMGAPKIDLSQVQRPRKR
ncbi:MAG: hypothetical protein A3C88_01975 [Candidatus Yanofskybacteria bacterium RIFCSPHIGHO2_02_FULL_50_12]|uniref:Uncharacterized protein n=1 Tax=Candidatus Yanofskybacteria bacterium RIFCSPHIGHO2_02_FULL_50_12 TaxID=1802685 RepID=A0A1F8FW21_9BACT|nr:MAG: hypothetical protein A3C88_01975 [Candidatus Yanofskybacteria bacterium RIFCSPHIGHO2_02_FULL_50_12]